VADEGKLVTNFINFDQRLEVVEKFSEVERLSRSEIQNPTFQTSISELTLLFPPQLTTPAAARTNDVEHAQPEPAPGEVLGALTTADTASHVSRQQL